MSLKGISVVIPAYNEENGIKDTVKEIEEVLNDLKIADFEIIIVNDGSTDKTKEIAHSTKAKVIDHPHNIGYGRSLKSGIQSAIFDTIVITDADRTYPFKEVGKLLSEYNKGFDMVVGARSGAFYRESWLKAPLRKILKFMVEFTAGRQIPDINSGLRVFSKSTSVNYFNHLCDTFSFTTSITLAYMMTSKFVTYCPINYEKREGDSKVRLLKDSLRTLQYIVQAITYYNPIKIFILFACLCLACAFIGFLGSAIFGLKSGFLLGIGSILVSLITLCFGLIADLLKQIMNK